MKFSKLILPITIIAAIGLIYFTYFAPTTELGSFSKFDPASEINQEIIVEIDRSKGFKRDAKGSIIGFTVRDKNGTTKNIALHEPAPEEIEEASKVTLLGHLHGEQFAVSNVTVIE